MKWSIQIYDDICKLIASLIHITQLPIWLELFFNFKVTEVSINNFASKQPFINMINVEEYGFWLSEFATVMRLLFKREISTTVSMPVFQTGYVGSIPISRSSPKILGVHGVRWWSLPVVLKLES